jgi:dipeptidyl aminopeptidase/acylaminoacyl peptidase
MGRISPIVTFCALAALVPALSHASPATRQIGAASLENVPEIPAGTRAAVQQYQNYRAALFQDWLADGSLLIATRFGATQQIHRVTAPGSDRTQITFFNEPVAGATTISGTNRFILSRDTGGDEWFQLYAMGLAGMPTLLTQPGTRNQSPVVSSDGKLLVWSQATRGSSEYTIYSADPANPASARSIHREPGSTNPTDISADKRWVLLTRGLSNRESRILLLDTQSGTTKELTPPKGKALYADSRFTADGRGIIVRTDRDSDVLRLARIDIADGRMTVLTPDLKWDVESFKLSPDGRLIAYAINEEGYSRVIVREVASDRTLNAPELPRGVLADMGFSPDGKQLALGFSTSNSPGDVWAWDLAAGKLTRWTTSELGELDPAALAEPQLVRFKSFDDLTVSAFVYRPRQLSADARTPVIIDIHGGPESQTRPSWNPGAQYFADVLGATVILPNVRGSAGYGKRYLNLDNAEKREDSVKDIGALLDWISQQPGLDKDRVAVYGQSYGGYMALAVMTHYADRLVGGVERYGISDFSSFLKNTESYRRDNRRAEYGDERDPKMQAVFKRISPLANVKRITRPMLVMQGANDPRVPKSESDQVVAGIRANGVEAWYVVFADEGHGFMKKPNNDLRREVETVFLARLFGVASGKGE